MKFRGGLLLCFVKFSRKASFSAACDTLGTDARDRRGIRDDHDGFGHDNNRGETGALS